MERCVSKPIRLYKQLIILIINKRMQEQIQSPFGFYQNQNQQPTHNLILQRLMFEIKTCIFGCQKEINQIIRRLQYLQYIMLEIQNQLAHIYELKISKGDFQNAKSEIICMKDKIFTISNYSSEVSLFEQQEWVHLTNAIKLPINGQTIQKCSVQEEVQQKKKKIEEQVGMGQNGEQREGTGGEEVGIDLQLVGQEVD